MNEFENMSPATESEIMREMFPGDEWDLVTFRETCSRCGVNMKRGERHTFNCSYHRCWQCNAALTEEEYAINDNRGLKCLKCRKQDDLKHELWRQSSKRESHA